MNVLNNEGTLASTTARSITLDLNAHPCDDRAPLKQETEAKTASYPGNSCAIVLQIED